MESRTNGLAWSKEPEPTLWNNKASPMMTWTIQNHKSHITGGISTWTTPPMEYPSCISCEPAYPIHWDRCTRPQLLPTNTRLNKRGSRIWSGGHQKPPMLWEEQKVAISPEVERLSREQQYMGTCWTITCPRPGETIPQAPSTWQDKECAAYKAEESSPILASPTLFYHSISTDDSDTLSYTSELSLDYQPCILQPSFVWQLATALCVSITKETYILLRLLVGTYPHPHTFHKFIPGAWMHYTHAHALESQFFCHKCGYCQYHTSY